MKVKPKRDSKGRFKSWPGGISKGKYSTYHGTIVHIGWEYRRQHGRKARVGACVRTKNKDGSYNKNAEWYVKTPYGWRKSKTKKRRPNSADIKSILNRSRKGRGK